MSRTRLLHCPDGACPELANPGAADAQISADLLQRSPCQLCPQDGLLALRQFIEQFMNMRDTSSGL